ncbi:MAG: glycosyltransferase family 9 protein [Pegethrix bostrychoides GSE-TBD4-15B]|jgi:ADP-heptose:LPS heptosyltransferase|uniref:Glycosyltransferase family 9 protein n=1 Tax=Pegethrix bostrychoides GSE-TBD4-15B TaxID=2839662 RepID=A0A951PDE7_9CYAN|nr:glycosyltransferase family 9 protein [Pegethrix bostrychoides GSE-TBD4-15B]
MRVVALVPGGIEQQILFFPTLDDLQQGYPNAELDVVVEPRAKAAYRISRSVNDVLTFDFKDRNSPADWANLLGILRDRDYEAVISAGGTGAGLLLWLTGIPTRVGFGNGYFFTSRIPKKSEQYAPQVYHDLLQGLGISTACPDLALRIPKSDQDWAQAERQRLGLEGYVLIDGSSDYPIASWQQIIQDLQQKQPEIPILLIQRDENREFVAALSQSCPGVKVSNPKDLGKLAALIAGANLMLCTEGSSMHLAVALEVYTLVLFGAADPAKLLPQQDKFLGIKSSTDQLADIAPEQVLQKVWGG